MLTFYFGPGASSMAPHIALHEVGAPFEGKPMSFARKDTRTPDFLAINPEGKVPTLLIDGRVLTEVAGILFYLARRFPTPACCRTATSRPRRRSSPGCRSSPRPIHPARRQGLEHARAIYALADKRLGKQRLGGGRPLLDRRHPPVPALLALPQLAQSRSPASFPNIEAHYDAHDGAAGGEEDHRGRVEDRLRAAGVRPASVRRSAPATPSPASPACRCG